MIGDEFYEGSMNKLSDLIKGKVIESTYINDKSDSYYFIIKFKDGSQLEIEYDWIYNWTLLDNDK